MSIQKGLPQIRRVHGKTTKQFVLEAKAVHGRRYDYSKVKYVRSNLPVTLVCQKHGEFSQKANNHIQGAGCPRCKVTLPYSKIAIEWIEKEARKRRLRNVQHAENGGEIRIPGTRYWVDGYHDRTKTVFEFYGDAFHGNLNVYKPTSRPHPFNESTARKLYNATMRRREELVLLGYKVISIWEHDYKELRNEH